MKNLFVFFLLGLALVQLSGSTETEEEKEISFLENQEDLEVQALADPRRGKGRTARNKSKEKKGSKGKGRKPKKSKTNRRKKGSKRNKNKAKGKKPRKGKWRKKNAKNPPKARGQTRCVAATCSDMIIDMMKMARKQNTYIKQFNRINNLRKHAAKKGGKKDEYGSDATDGPLNLLIAAGGGNASDLSCAGSKTNKAAESMKNLTAKLGKCKEEMGEICNVTKQMVAIKDAWKACNESMLSFKNKTDICLKLSGAEACTCFQGIAALKDKVKACNGTEMKIAAASDLKAKKACMAVFGDCRANGEKIRPVLAACQAGGPSVADVKLAIGAILVNAAANDKIKNKTTELVASAGRKFSKRADVTFGGTTYKLDTCALWAEAALAWIAALDADLETDISPAGKTIADTTVTCTAEDVLALNKVAAASAKVAKKAAKKVEILQKKLAQITGTTVSPTDAVAVATGTTAAAGAVATTNTMMVRRKVHKILAGFRNKL